MTHVVEINNPALPIAGETRLAPKSTAGWRFRSETALSWNRQRRVINLNNVGHE